MPMTCCIISGVTIKPRIGVSPKWLVTFSGLTNAIATVPFDRVISVSAFTGPSGIVIVEVPVAVVSFVSGSNSVPSCVKLDILWVCVAVPSNISMNHIASKPVMLPYCPALVVLVVALPATAVAF